MAKATIALSLDEEVIAELRRISADSDAPLSRIVNRRLRDSFHMKAAQK